MSTTFAYVYKWTQLSTGKWYIGSKSSKGCHPDNVYKWTQLSTGKWYIGSKSSKGCHPANHEKYKCSKSLVKTLITENRNDWIYEIWDIGDPLEIRELERIYLTILNAKSNPMSYNESNGYWDPGNRLGRKESPATRQKKSIARQGTKNPMFKRIRENLFDYFKRKIKPNELQRKQRILGSRK